MQTKLGLLSLIFLLVLSCEDPYFPKLDKYDNLLVVDGRITDQPGPYTVRLNLSSELYVEEFLPLSGAIVKISDDAGNSETLQEEAPGVYTTSPSGIQGIAGRKYKIEIATTDGRHYASEEEILQAAVPIDTLTAAVEYRQNVNFDYDLGGYQFYLTSGLSPKAENYYLWESDATYQYVTDYLIRFIFQGGYQPYPDPDEFHTCWLTFPVQQIATYNTLNLESPQVFDFPIHFVDTETRQLAIRYSLLVRQYSLSPEAYTFWEAIEAQIGEQGALYSRQPYQIRGNVKDVDRPEEPVMGYFLVAGVSEKRIFVYPPEDVPFHYTNCQLITENLSRIINPGDFVGVNEEGRRGIGSGFCLDCRQVGGTIRKPDFWID